jgi:hypothetical protein
MNFKNLMIVGVLGLTTIACKKKKKDEEPQPQVVTTVQEDKQNIAKTFDEMNQCAAEVKSGKMISLIKNVFEIDKGDAPVYEDQWMMSIVDSLPNVFDFDTITSGLELNAGIVKGNYTYNKNTKNWDKTAGTGNDIAFMFPSQDGGANDLKVVFKNYSDEKHNIDGDMIGLPKTFEMTFTQNNEVLTQLKLNSVTYEEHGTITIPTYIDASMVFAPLNVTFVARKVSSTLFDVNVDISNNGSCSSHFFAEAKLNSDDYENLTEDNFDYIKGYASFNNLKITSNINVATIAAITDPTVNQINSMLDLDVLYKDQKIGELEYFKDDNAGDITEGLNIVYKDGTKENVTDVYLTPFVDDLELTLFDLLGNWEESSSAVETVN